MLAKISERLPEFYPMAFPPSTLQPPLQKRKRREVKPHYDWTDADRAGRKWLADHGALMPRVPGENLASLERVMEEAFPESRRPSECQIRVRARRLAEAHMVKKAGLKPA
jgi:hypothetical protein